MSTEAIYQKYINAMQQITGDGTWVDWSAVRLALRLAVQDAHAAGMATCSGVADDLAAIAANQDKALQHALAQVDPLREERNTLIQQLAQLDADNASLTQRLRVLDGVQAGAARLRQEIADLREQVIPEYQAELAKATAEIDRLTRENGIAVATFNSLREPATNGAGPVAESLPAPLQATWWYDNLDEETNDWRVSIEAGRRTFRQVPKGQRLLLAQAVARAIGQGALPKQSDFDAGKPHWMPGAGGLAQAFGCNWAELLTVTPFEVAP